LGLEGETLAEGQLRTTPESFAELFQTLSATRVVIEVGTHSAWVREVVVSCGHEVLVANPWLMDGTKRRKRKNDRVDANKLARVGRMDSQSLFPGRAPEYGSAARPGGATGAGCIGGGADATDQHHAGIGEECGRTAAQVFQRELPA
jgi:hypothetical protein